MTTILKNFVRIESGYPFRGRIEPCHAKQGEQEGYVVQTRNIDSNGEIQAHELTKTSLPGKRDPSWLKPDDILFLAKGPKNTATLVRDLPENTVCSPHFFHLKIRPSKYSPALAEFICWQLNQREAQKYFKISAEGSLQVSIRKGVLEDTPIFLPDLKTQKHIIALNRCVIEETKTYHKLIENRQQQMSAIATKLLETNNINDKD